MRIVEGRVRRGLEFWHGSIRRLLLLGLLLRYMSLALFRLFLPDTMDTSARIDVIVHRPVRAFAPIRQWTCYFLKARVEGQIVTDGVLPARRSSPEVWEPRLDCIVYIFQQQLPSRRPLNSIPYKRRIRVEWLAPRRAIPERIEVNGQPTSELMVAGVRIVRARWHHTAGAGRCALLRTTEHARGEDLRTLLLRHVCAMVLDTAVVVVQVQNVLQAGRGGADSGRANPR